FYDDYAHHPTEIRATLAAAAMVGGRRLIAFFQPHRYTRTQLLAEMFGGAFDGADHLVLLPIYSAGENPIPGVDSGLIGEAVYRRTGRRPAQAPGVQEAAAMAAADLRAGDVVLTLGAGNIRRLGELLLRGGG
ncbi:MAG: UDP-N-acetylmuramate--L-alanine ligase, partial [Peptococcaceae bacterium]|nr:UDP-N-acetylmuramate--L-alanine ligase [Peptococcaceae bacterium]